MTGLSTTRGGKRTAEIRAHLEENILNGVLPPGARLDETEIAAKFSVSRTPVREALLQLASLGLLETGKRRGAVVARMSVERIVAMMEVMGELEGLATRLAAQRMTAREHEALRAVHAASARCVADNDVACFDAANKELHELIYAGCRNEFLAGQIRDIRRRLWVYRGFPFQRPGRMAVSFRDHGAVIEAIIQGDGATAEACMLEHISVGSTDFADLVAKLTRPEPAKQP